MRKTDADEVKERFDKAVGEQSALDYMPQKALDISLHNLDTFTFLLESEISDFALDSHHDLLDTEDFTIIRAFWFSKGMDDYYICIDAHKRIKAFEEDTPLSLVSQVAEALDSLVGEEE